MNRVKCNTQGERKWLSKAAGVTLLEVLLALTIGALIMVMGIRMYMTYRLQADYGLLRTNVDIIFQGLTRYFQANCNRAPFNSFSTASVPVTVNFLRTNGYMSQTIAPNGLVDAGSTNGGYIVQFNQIQVSGALPQRMIQTSPTRATRSMGSIIVWRAQVAVMLSNPTRTQAVAAVMGADCVGRGSGTGGSNATVGACGSGSGSLQYLVWERLPTLTSSRQNSPLWQFMPSVRQFRQMYTTDPVLILIDPATIPNQLSRQFYVCGT